MKTDYKPGDKVVITKRHYDGPSDRYVGRVLTVKGLNPNPANRFEWQVFFEETLGLDFEHIRPLTLLEKELLE